MRMVLEKSFGCTPSCPVLLCQAIPYTCPILPRPAILCLTLPYFALPYLTLPYLTVPYLTFPYLTLPIIDFTLSDVHV